ncbi:LemA family protein [Candidatus Woesearchaeota archaeon]|nr:LemA family protein [Candidatus Woesearchaeota archaeon]
MARKVNSFWNKNKSWIIPVGIVVVLFLFLLMWFVGSYNGLISTRENVYTQWANVETQYQRRADLIPNLVETVSAFATQERTVFEEVTTARASVGKIQLSAEDLSDPVKVKAFADAQAQLGGALTKLLAVAENYPQLKSGENFLALQSQLEGTENRIAVSRRDYNEAVKVLNIRVQRIPTVIIANMFGFDKATPFEADEGAETVPVVAFPEITD